MDIDDKYNYWWWANYCRDKMEPCPFCGGKGKFNLDHVFGSLVYIVYCVECGIKKRFGESSWWDKRKSKTEYTNQEMYRGLSGMALRFWNKRQ